MQRLSNETVEQTSTYTDNWRKAYPTTRLVARVLRVLEECAARVCWESVLGERNNTYRIRLFDLWRKTAFESCRLIELEGK